MGIYIVPTSLAWAQPYLNFFCLLPCYYLVAFPLLLCSLVTLSPCFDLLLCSLVTLLLCYLVPLLPCYSFTLFSGDSVALLPCSLVTLLLYSLVTLLPCYSVALLPCYSVVIFLILVDFCVTSRNFFPRWTRFLGVRSWLNGLHYKSVFVHSN